MTARLRLLAAATLLLGAATAQAQPSWLRNLGPGGHALCCGPRGDLGYENPARLIDFNAPHDILRQAEPEQPQAIATLALGAAASAPAAVPAPTVQPAAAPDAAGVYQVTFDQLSAFEFVAPTEESKAPEAEKQIPGPVRALDAKKVAVTGFMLPVKMNEGFVTEFLLVKDPMMCCYGVMPKINEWVVVKMTGKGVPPLMDVPITFEGTLSVGQIYESGYLTGLYLLKGDRRVESKG